MKNNKTILLLRLISKLVLFIALQLFSKHYCTAQNTALELKSQFENYQIDHLQEKIFVHTDRSFYLAGETIWFKAYLIDGFLNKPLALSKVIYVEIIDKYLHPVLQTKIGTENAMGNGAISIPVSINSGNYTLRAYTQWMKNFNAAFFYEQSVTIVNTVQEKPLPDTSFSKEIDFNFFPEGGNLINGLTSKVAFKATGKNGKGINCDGVILNNKNDTIVKFKSFLFGMGNFIFTPQKNEKYTAIIKLDNDTFITKSMPVIYNSGYTLNVEKSTDSQIATTINISSDLAGLPVYLFIQSHHLIKSVQYGTPVNGKITFNINASDLADGISQFTIFNNDKKPVCERLYFKQPTDKLSINIGLKNIVSAPRKNVNVQINTTDKLKNSTPADLSMSVFMLDSLQQATYPDIQSYLLLSSDLKGEIESPEYYFDENNKNANAAVDNLMLTQGWRRFKWEDILQSKKKYFEFMPEYEGMIVSGKITDKISGLPVKNTGAYLSVPNKLFQFFNAQSNELGKINYSLKYLYGTNQIITQADTNNNYQIDIDNPFSDIFSGNIQSTFNFNGNIKSDLLKRHIAMEVQHTYNISENRKFILSPNIDTATFYGSPTYSFNLDAFTRFNTMEEVIREFITDVQLRIKDNVPYFRVYDHATQALFDSDPLLLIDGIPIIDPNKIVSFNPLKIKTIDVLSNKYFLGGATFSGIISFKTYDGDLAGYQLDANAVALQFDGLQQQREFYSPKYNTELQQQSRIPDFRNTLCWLPVLKTDSTGKTDISFFTSDITGKFAIVVQGITKSGKVGSSISTFEVKP